MIELTAKLAPRAQGDVQGQLLLPFSLRQKRWLLAALVSGEEAALKLPRGTTLHGGDLLLAADGRVIEVIAAAERVVHVECATPIQLTRVAYHLGNRHVPVQIGNAFLRIGEDHVVEKMLLGLGAKLTLIEAPFEPESGAYAGTHADADHGATRSGRIHEFAESQRSNE